MKSEIDILYKHFLKHPFVCTDSRIIVKNSIFFALRGDTFNGNNFAESALQNGASFVVVDEPQNTKDSRYVLVEDSLSALQALAKVHRRNLKGTIIGITGSNGKTTTKELINKVLSEKFTTKATKGNLNNHIGVPLTLLSFPAELEFGIVEMGANHIGEIAALCDIARPDFGLITNIGKAHLEGFGSFEGVIKGKSELYDFLRINNKKAFLNIDNEILVKEAKNIDCISYGSNSQATIHGQLLGSIPLVSCEVKSQGGSITLSSHLTGRYNFENILAAVAVGTYFGVEPEKIKSAVENYLPENNRSQLVKTKNNILVLDAYNANPTSMKAAISGFEETAYNNKVLILGGMAELGDYSEEEHNSIVNLAKGKPFDHVYLVGKEYANAILENGSCFNSTSEFYDYLKVHPIKNKTILIKGSRSNKLENIFELL